MVVESVFMASIFAWALVSLIVGSLTSTQQPRHHPEQQLPWRYLESSHKIFKKAGVTTLHFFKAFYFDTNFKIFRNE